MNDPVYIVTIDTQGDPERWGFTDIDLAEQYAAVRGNADVEAVTVLGEHDAKRMIDDEAKERRDEERFERMRQEGEI